MAIVMTVEYKDPADSAIKTKSVTMDIARFRPDSEPSVIEKVFLKASASGYSDVYEDIDRLSSDILDGKPSSARFGITQSYIDTAFSSGGTALSVTPAANASGNAFVVDVPCVVLSAYGTVVGYFTPTAVSADFTLEATGAGSLQANADIGAIVQQFKVFDSPIGENAIVGIKAQLERPGTPSATVAAGAGTSLDVTITAPTTKVSTVTHYDIYASDATLLVDGTPVIEPNRTPDKADVTAASIGSAQNITTYGGGTDAGGGTMSGTTTYYVVVVAKDGAGQVDVNESALSTQVSAATS
jgi:hypothetical protein